MGCILLHRRGEISDPHPDDEMRLYRAIARGDKKSRDIMIARHKGLAVQMAETYAKKNPHIDIDDLIQEGQVGLVKAISKYDCERGIRFSTYARWWVKRYINRFMLSHYSNGAYMPRSMVERIVANDESLDSEDVKIISDRCANPYRLDEHDENNVYGSDDSDIFLKAQSSIRWKQLEDALLTGNHLSQNEFLVLVMSFGVMGYNQMTNKEISDRIGLRINDVSKIKYQSIQKLSELLDEREEV